jgi:prephenate dehydratase
MAKSTITKRRPGKSEPSQTIAFQGLPGAYSDLACREVFPRLATLPTATFEETFAAVERGKAALAMIPIENSVAGRVADIHMLMPHATKLHIIGEHFQRVNHHLWRCLAPA